MTIEEIEHMLLWEELDRKLPPEIEDDRIYRLKVLEPDQRRQERIFLRPLSVTEIVVGFPEEIKDILPRVLAKLESNIAEYEQKKNIIYNKALNYLTKEYANELAEGVMPKEKVDHMKKLRAIQSTVNPTFKNRELFKQEDIDKAKKVDIRTLYSFNKPRAYGNRFVACCPFGTHSDNTPSFMINTKNTYKCFSCNAGGSSIDFTMQIHKMTFPQAVKFLLGKI